MRRINMHMQETLHMCYLSSAALALKACDDLAMGNRTGPARSHLHRIKLQVVPPEKGERRALVFAKNPRLIKKVE